MANSITMRIYETNEERFNGGWVKVRVVEVVVRRDKEGVKI